MHCSRNIPEAETSSRADPGGTSPAFGLAVSMVGSLLGTKDFPFLGIWPQRLSRPVGIVCIMDMQMNRFHVPPTCTPSPPTRLPRGCGILCRDLHGQAWTLPACLLFGLKLGCKSCTRGRVGARFMLPVALDSLVRVHRSLGVGSVHLWKVCFSAEDCL